MLKGKKILIIGKVWPEPKSSAAGIRMMQLIDFFQRFEMKITFVSAANQTDFQVDLSETNIDFKQIELNDDSFNEFVEELKPDVVVFDRFLTEEQFGWRIDESAPNSVKILNTEDLHFLRGAREEAVKKNETMDVTSVRSDLFQRELISVYRCDLTLLVSEFEKNLLEKEYSISPDLLHYRPVFSEKKEEIKTFEEREDFMFIGNFYHAPNWDAVKVLKNEIWPLIREKLPKAKLHIYGAYPGQRVTDLNNEKNGFIVHGRVEDAMSATEQVKVSLVPLRFGAGIKGKLLEAMSAGTPSVTTSIGSEGMSFEKKWGGAVEDDFVLFAQAAIELYENKGKWHQAQEVGFRILDERFNEEKFEDSFVNVLQLLLEDCDSIRKNNIVGSLLKHHSVQSSKYLSKWIMEKNK